MKKNKITVTVEEWLPDHGWEIVGSEEWDEDIWFGDHTKRTGETVRCYRQKTVTLSLNTKGMPDYLKKLRQIDLLSGFRNNAR